MLTVLTNIGFFFTCEREHSKLPCTLVQCRHCCDILFWARCLVKGQLGGTVTAYRAVFCTKNRGYFPATKDAYGTPPQNGHTADQEASFPHRAVRGPPARGADDRAAFVPR